MAWTVSFAAEFEPEFDAFPAAVQDALLARAILLVGGDKSGGSEQRFYKSPISRADDRFDRHLGNRKG